MNQHRFFKDKILRFLPENMDFTGMNYHQPMVPPHQIRHRLSKPSYQRYRKPPYTYTGMIIMAIQLSAKKKLLLSEIHEALGKMFPFFRQSSYTGWKDSVRHNLSHNQCFTMILKDPSKKNGKGNFWTVDLSLVQPDVFRRQDTPVSREGKWAPDLHDQLECPPVILPTSSQRQAVTSRPAETTNGRNSRKRKLDDIPEASVSLPREKRHQPFHIDSLLQAPHRVPREYVMPYSSCAFSNFPPSLYPHAPVPAPPSCLPQPLTPDPGQEGLLSACSDDSGCYLSSSSSATSPETFPVNSRGIPPSPRFPPEDCARAIEMSFWDYFWPTFDGILPALESAIPSATNVPTTSNSELLSCRGNQPVSSRDFSSCAVTSGTYLPHHLDAPYAAQASQPTYVTPFAVKEERKASPDFADFPDCISSVTVKKEFIPKDFTYP